MAKNKKMTAAEKEAALAARPEFQFGLATGDGTVYLTIDRVFRNRANVREAAAAWAAKHEIGVGDVVVLKNGSVDETLTPEALAARRKPHEDQSAAYSGIPVEKRK